MTEQPNSWQAVKRAVLRRIESREWPPGAAIPNEVDLAAQFGCARSTVNRALRALAEDGVLERRRKAGTRVALHPVRQARFAIPIIRQDVEARGAGHGYRLLSRDHAPMPEALRAELDGTILPERLDHVLALHLADGKAFVLEDRWTNPEAVPDISCADLSVMSANEWLVENVPFSGGKLSFAAVAATPDVATLLGAAPGAALFMAERTTWRAGVFITGVRLTYAEGYRMRTAL